MNRQYGYLEITKDKLVLKVKELYHAPQVDALIKVFTNMYGLEKPECSWRYVPAIHETQIYFSFDNPQAVKDKVRDVNIEKYGVVIS